MTELSGTLWAAGGGALGAYFRFHISTCFTRCFGENFPYGTLFVNVSGSLLMGLLAGGIKAGMVPMIPWHNYVGECFLGALTTFSTFSMDTFKAYHNGEPAKASLNLITNMVLCISGTALGFYLIG